MFTATVPLASGIGASTAGPTWTGASVSGARKKPPDNHRKRRKTSPNLEPRTSPSVPTGRNQCWATPAPQPAPTLTRTTRALRARFGSIAQTRTASPRRTVEANCESRVARRHAYAASENREPKDPEQYQLQNQRHHKQCGGGAGAGGGRGGNRRGSRMMGDSEGFRGWYGREGRGGRGGRSKKRVQEEARGGESRMHLEDC